jgi:hypothetical protein
MLESECGPENLFFDSYEYALVVSGLNQWILLHGLHGLTFTRQKQLVSSFVFSVEIWIFLFEIRNQRELFCKIFTQKEQRVFSCSKMLQEGTK